MAEPAPLGVPEALWDVLACPCPQHAGVEADERAGQIVCTHCATRFDVRDGVPVMLLDEATPGPHGVGVGPADATSGDAGPGAVGEA